MQRLDFEHLCDDAAGHDDQRRSSASILRQAVAVCNASRAKANPQTRRLVPGLRRRLAVRREHGRGRRLHRDQCRLLRARRAAGIFGRRPGARRARRAGGHGLRRLPLFAVRARRHKRPAVQLRCWTIALCAAEHPPSSAASLATCCPPAPSCEGGVLAPPAAGWVWDGPRQYFVLHACTSSARPRRASGRARADPVDAPCRA